MITLTTTTTTLPWKTRGMCSFHIPWVRRPSHSGQSHLKFPVPMRSGQVLSVASVLPYRLGNACNSSIGSQFSITNSFPLTQGSQGMPGKREERVSVFRGSRVKLKQLTHHTPRGKYHREIPRERLPYEKVRMLLVSLLFPSDWSSLRVAFKFSGKPRPQPLRTGFSSLPGSLYNFVVAYGKQRDVLVEKN